MTDDIYGGQSGIAVRNLTRENGDPSSYCYTSVVQDPVSKKPKTQTVLIDLGRYESPEKIGKGEYNCVTPDIMDILKDDKPAALFLTHAHSDHVDGVFEYVQRALEAMKKGKEFPDFPPVVASPTVIAMLEDGFSKRGINRAKWKKVLKMEPIHAGQTAVIVDGKVEIYDKDKVPGKNELPKDALTVKATVAPHSIPDSLSFTLDNGAAKVFHSGDFRPDTTSTVSEVIARAAATKKFSFLQGVMPAYNEKTIPQDCDMAVVDYGNAATTDSVTGDHARTEAQIVENYKNVMTAEPSDKEIVALIQSNHVERLFSIIKAGIQQGRPVIIDGGTEMDLHLMSVLNAINEERPFGAPEVKLQDLFNSLQPQPPAKRVPIIYRAAHASESENKNKEARKLLNETPAPVLVASGIYGETDPGATLYDALNGKYGKKKEDFPIKSDAHIIVTTDFNTFEVETFKPLKHIQDELKKGKSFRDGGFDELRLDQLPLNFREWLHKEFKEFEISEENLWVRNKYGNIDIKDGEAVIPPSPMTWKQLREKLPKDVFDKILKEMEDRLAKTPDITGMTLDTAKSEKYRSEHNLELTLYDQLDGPGHACSADIRDLLTRLGKKCHIVPVHTTEWKKEEAQKLGLMEHSFDRKPGARIFITRGQEPVVVQENDNTVLLSSRHFNKKGQQTEASVHPDSVSFNRYSAGEESLTSNNTKLLLTRTEKKVAKLLSKITMMEEKKEILKKQRQIDAAGRKIERLKKKKERIER